MHGKDVVSICAGSESDNQSRADSALEYSERERKRVEEALLITTLFKQFSKVLN